MELNKIQNKLNSGVSKTYYENVLHLKCKSIKVLQETNWNPPYILLNVYFEIKEGEKNVKNLQFRLNLTVSHIS